MEQVIALDEAINNYPKLVSEATYICYKYNRERSPSVTPEEWKVVFGNTDAMEKRYQEESK